MRARLPAKIPASIALAASIAIHATLAYSISSPRFRRAFDFMEVTSHAWLASARSSIFCVFENLEPRPMFAHEVNEALHTI